MTMVKFLLKNKAKPIGLSQAFSNHNWNFQNNAEDKAQMYNLLKILLDAGADPNEGHILGYVAKSGDIELVKLLLKAGADVNTTIYQTDTPLMFAAEEGNYDLVQLLLDNKADVNIGGDVNNFNVFTQTLESRAPRNLIKILRLLIQKGSNLEEAHIDGLIYNVIMENQTEVFKLLKNPQTDNNTKDWVGNNALYWAAETGNLIIAKTLIAYGVKDVDAKDHEHGRTALIRSIVNNDCEMAELIINSGSEVNVEEGTSELGDYFPLAEAIRKGNTKMVDLLLKHGAKVNGIGNTQDWRPENMPLGAAISTGNIELAEKLIKLGANACWENKHITNGTLLDVATIKNDPKIIQLIKSNCWQYFLKK